MKYIIYKYYELVLSIVFFLVAATLSGISGYTGELLYFILAILFTVVSFLYYKSHQIRNGKES